MASFYDRVILPLLIDRACGLGPIRWLRRGVIPDAEGRVLEIGIGSGHNFRYYDPGRVSAVVGVDPAGDMTTKARDRAEAAGLAVDLRTLSAETLPLDTGDVDTVVCTFSLCTIPDAAAALGEMRRVLKPGGRLLFAEHGRSPDARVRRWQDRLDRPWGWIAGGCHLNRPIDALIREAGFGFDRLDTGYMRKTPPTHGFYYAGTARKAPSVTSGGPRP